MPKEKAHGPVSERFMRHHYGASGLVKGKDAPPWQDAFDAWWKVHGLNYPEQKYFARWVWSAAWNEVSEK